MPDAAPIVQPRKPADFARLAESMPFIVWTATPDGAVDYFNLAFTEYTGQSPDLLLADGWLTVLHPEDVPLVLARWESSLASGSPYEVDFRIRRADGEYRWHRVQARAETSEKGKVVRWWGSGVDIHELHLLRAQAATLAEEREAILESIVDGVLTLDRDFRFTYLNSNAEKLTERTRDELIGKIFWDAFPETRGSDLLEMFQRVVETRTPERIEDYGAPMRRWFEVSANPTPDGLTVYLRDITQMKSLSDQLAIAQRMEAMGQLTGGIAHDFNNLLTVIIGGTESLLDEPNLSDHCRDTLDLFSQATSKAAELTHRLLAFARKQPLAPQAINVSHYVSEIVPLLRRTLGEGVRIVTSLAEDVPAANVDPGQFENALLNLGINARDAMPEGGTLTLETYAVHLEEPQPALHRLVPPGNYVATTVSDTGTGIPAEFLGRLFDPFFTTKPVGQGSGLGLAMVYGFIRQSEGYVAVYSEEGRGTTIRLYLPVASDETMTSTVEPTQPTPLHQGTGHILLVEDDELVRHFTATHLMAHGYEVTSASSGPEAIALLDSIDRLDLLLTDVIMPGGMTGAQLAARILQRRPGTPILYSSGYTENVNLGDGLSGREISFLSKPYSGTQLIDAIQRLIAPPTAEESAT